MADTTGGSPINGTGLPANCWPSLWPTDGREGGVPDPTTAGPPLIELGAEGGLLPAPAVIPSTPVSYEYNRRSITVLNVFGHGLLAGPAERADLVVDFSSVPAGSALILYNDGPAPIPAIDPRVDYFTGDTDNTPTGGAPSTPPGYGPNTRTVMQFSLAALQTAQPSIFAATQDPIILPQTAYPAANGGAPSDTYARIQDTSISYFDHGAVGSLTLTSGGTGYPSAPTVTIAPPSTCVLGSPGCTQATATATVAGSVANVTLVPNTSRYTTTPAVTFAGGGGTGASAISVLAPTSVASVVISPANTIFGSAPTITITPPCVGCVAATATAVMNANGTVRSNTVANPGGPYMGRVNQAIILVRLPDGPPRHHRGTSRRQGADRHRDPEPHGGDTGHPRCGRRRRWLHLGSRGDVERRRRRRRHGDRQRPVAAAVVQDDPGALHPRLRADERHARG